ncbi:MAG: hypothetical protein HN576_16570 [Bacteriovoracaceae bacterium]|jgi:uncharacterized HAD superfamily protein|nr:hypothetical protein [Bacteriovoracaceae bacterium]
MSVAKQKAIIVDLDGTLCNVDHRVHHVQKKEKDWKLFNEGMAHDGIYLWCFELILSMKNSGYEIIFLTGRDNSYRDQTCTWLEKNKIQYDTLHMREVTDHREDHIIKNEIYKRVIEPQKNVLFVLDDRLSVVKMWREIGLICLQCDWGDF